MCKCCEGKEDISNRIFEDGSKFSDCMVKVYIDNIFNEKKLIVSPVKYENGKRQQYMKYTFKINYCPICGRKLNEIEKNMPEEQAQKVLDENKKIINLMAEMINNHDIDEDICKQMGQKENCNKFTDEKMYVECIKQYFRNKVKEK